MNFFNLYNCKKDSHPQINFRFDFNCFYFSLILVYMKKVLISLIFIGLCVSFNLKLTSPLVLDDQYELTCEDAVGEVRYAAHNLPQGVRLAGNTIEIYDAEQVKEGPMPIRITAEDSLGQYTERLVVIIFKKKIQNIQTTQTNTIVNQQQTNTDVNRVLDDLLIPTNIRTNYQYPENGYPTNNMPTGFDESRPNFTPQRIATTKATRSQANRNTITSDDVKANAIFQRQLNAAKALANLLSIIKQATANRNGALAEIQKRTKLHEEAISSQRTAEGNIVKAENDLARINQGIQSTNQRINELRAKIETLISQREKKKAQRQSLLEGITNAQINLKKTQNQLKKQKQNLANAEFDLDDKKAECDALSEEYSSTAEEISNRKLERASLTIEINAAGKTVETNTANVAQIKKQLAKAEAQLKASQEDLNRLRRAGEELNRKIKDLENRLADLSARVDQCKKELADIQARVDELKNKIIPAIEIKKLEIENQIKKLTSEEGILAKRLAEIPKEIEELERTQPKLIDSLRLLRSQVFVFETRLRGAYQAGNTANHKFSETKENLEAANKKFLHEDKVIQEATQNIQLARIEKEQADQAVENYLMQGVDLLPFAAAPGETGFEAIGGGQFAIKSWQEYVEIAYGKGIKPLFIGDLKSLYSFKVTEEEAGECAAENQRSVSGYIIQVMDSGIRMINDEGNEYQISYSSCTRALSNVKGYEFAAGDIVVLKGVQNDNKIDATQLTCIRR